MYALILLYALMAAVHYWFVVDVVFDAISECQSYHPDPELSTDSEGDQEGDNPMIGDVMEINECNGFFRTVEDLQYLSTEGQRTLDHLESLLEGSGAGNGVFH